jgi:hypothetical protein
MELEEGGTFDGQQGFPQPSSLLITGTFNSGGQQYPQCLVCSLSSAFSPPPTTFLSDFE